MSRYRGARLAAALERADATAADVNPVEHQFLAASKAQADHELRTARRQVRRTRRLAAGLAAVLVLTLIATGLAVGYQRTSDARAREADANRLAALSTSSGLPLDLSLLLAAQATRLSQTPERHATACSPRSCLTDERCAP